MKLVCYCLLLSFGVSMVPIQGSELDPVDITETLQFIWRTLVRYYRESNFGQNPPGILSSLSLILIVSSIINVLAFNSIRLRQTPILIRHTQQHSCKISPALLQARILEYIFPPLNTLLKPRYQCKTNLFLQRSNVGTSAKASGKWYRKNYKQKSQPIVLANFTAKISVIGSVILLGTLAQLRF